MTSIRRICFNMCLSVLWQVLHSADIMQLQFLLYAAMASDFNVNAHGRLTGTNVVCNESYSKVCGKLCETFSK